MTPARPPASSDPSATTLLSEVEVNGRRVDVLLSGGTVRRVEPAGATRARGWGTTVDHRIDGAGGALLPGLHDHHVHLMSWAASIASVDCAGPEVRSFDELSAALLAAPTGSIRGVGYHEAVAGPLDRWLLDRVSQERPIRVQHASGGLWMLNSAALRLLPPSIRTHPDAERDHAGRVNGRLWRLDDILSSGGSPDLSAVATELRTTGVTGVTDATPDADGSRTAALVAAARRADLPTRVVLLGPADAPHGVPDGLPDGWSLGPRKILLHDHDLPPLDELSARIAATHRTGRAVAVHCVTRESLLLTIAALDDVGALAGDRIEHAAVVPPEARAGLRRHRLTVVTQPAMLADRGDRYLAEVAEDDVELLYPFRSLLAAGVAVAGSSDAPFGPADPWSVMCAARDRRTRRGVVLVPSERVATREALAGYLRDGADPGGLERRVAPGAPADLTLLHTPLAPALDRPSRDLVRCVWHQHAPRPSLSN